MRIKKLLLLLIIISILIPGIIYAGKLDGRLRLLLDKYKGKIKSGTRAKIAESILNPDKTTVNILAVVNDPSVITTYGGTIRTIAGDVVTATIPVWSLDALSRAGGLIHASAATKMKTRVNIGVPLMNADTAYNAGYIGTNCIVGVVDSGISWDHEMFKNADGKSRILYIWDQTVSGTGPSSPSYSYGKEWTKADIDAGNCTENDTGGHGTHVAGIAAGSGILKGVAKGANIIFVKTSFDNDKIIDGINYILKKAELLNKPAVVNLSLGSMEGPHDGTDAFPKALDNLVDTGKIIVKSSGNSGKFTLYSGVNEKIHTYITASKQTNIIPFQTGSYTPNTGGLNDVLSFDIWYSANESFEFVLACSNTTTGSNDILIDVFDGQQLSTTNTNYGYIQVDNASGGINPLNNCKRIQFSLSDTADGSYPPLDTASWKIVLFTTNYHNSRVDLWMTTYGGNVPFYFDNAVDEGTMDSDSCGQKAIIVGALITRTIYTDINGVVRTNNYGHGGAGVGDIADFSSKGPTRDNRYKPDASAPGARILSARSSSYSVSASDIDCRYTNYIYMEGTSMAAPMVTGAVALLLDRNKELTFDDVLNYIKTHSQGSGTYKTDPGIWDKAFGYGVFDLSKILSLDEYKDYSTPEIAANVYDNYVDLSKDNQSAKIVLGQSDNIEVYILNLAGTVVKKIDKKYYSKGDRIIWQGDNNNGQKVGSGIYLILVKGDSFKKILKVMVKN